MQSEEKPVDQTQEIKTKKLCGVNISEFDLLVFIF